MKRAFLVAFREVRNYLQDKADMAFTLLLPIVTFALIYGAFGGQTRPCAERRRDIESSTHREADASG